MQERRESEKGRRSGREERRVSALLKQRKGRAHQLTSEREEYKGMTREGQEKGKRRAEAGCN